MIRCRLIVVTVLAVSLLSSGPGASASTSPYSMSDIGPAPATDFRISDIDPAPAAGYDATDRSDHAPAAPADLFKISAVSPR